MERLKTISSHLQKNQTKAGPTSKTPNDVVICCALRTPLTKSGRGPLKDTPPEQLLTPLFKAVVERTKIDPKNIQDVVIGNVLQSGSGVYASRMSQYLAGWPDQITTVAMNRLCASGLETVATVAAKIQAGIIDIGLAGGVENMSMYDMQSSVNPELISDEVFENEAARNCLLPMGQTSENVAEKFGINRETQDKFAVESHRKAAKAQEEGLFKDEIVPIKAKVKDKDGKVTEVLVNKDDGIRKETTVEGLKKLRPAFKKDGTTTAGNSSQVTDGAAVVLLAKRSSAEKLGLPILAKFVAYAVAGVPPEVMGIGPAFAIPAVLEKAGMTKEDIDIFEVNEAFASQAAYCCNKLGLDANKVNPKGGAIAFGHPLGATGSRQVATLLPELKRTGGRYGLISMCIGTGMGAAAIIEKQ